MAYVVLGFKPRALGTLLWSPSFCPHLSYLFTSSEPPPLLLVMPAAHLDIFLCLGTRRTTFNTTDRLQSSWNGADSAQSGSSLQGPAFLEQAPAGLMSPGRNRRPPTEACGQLFPQCLCLPKEDDLLCHPAQSLQSDSLAFGTSA